MLQVTHFHRCARAVSISVCLLAIVLTSRSAFATITFSQNFDSGSLNVAGTTVDVSDPLRPGISVAPRYNYQGTWGWFYFEATGVNGLTPQFSHPGDAPTLTNDNRYVYSYDQQNWHFFDNGTSTPSKFFFSNNTPFTQNSVYIAQVVPYPVSRTDAWVAAAKSNPYVLPTVSANSDLVIGRTLGTAGGGYYDDLGRSVPAQNLYGFKITDPSAGGTKSKVVLMTGNHSCEANGTWAFEGLVNFLMSDDPIAASLRRKAEFYVYPQTCPEGRAAGYWRSGPDSPNTNHNRVWDNPGSITDVRLTEQAMKADTGSTNVEYFFDFHQSAGPHLVQISIRNDCVGTPFVDALNSLIPQLDIFPWDNLSSYSDSWAVSSAGLNAKYAIIPEMGMLVDVPLDGILAYGKDYGLALYDAIVPEPSILALCACGGLALLRRRRAGRSAQ
jgi:hypothetical protein